MGERKPVPRIGRLLDAVAAIGFLAGAGFYARSWVGLRRMDEYARPENGDLFAAVTRADELSRLGRIGLALMICSVLIGVIAAVVARRVAAREA